MQESLPPIHITCSALQRASDARASRPLVCVLAGRRPTPGPPSRLFRVADRVWCTRECSHGIAPPRAELRVAHAFDASRKGPCPRPPPLAAPPSLLPLHSLSSTSLLTMPRGRPRLQASYDGDSDSACSSSASSSGDDLTPARPRRLCRQVGPSAHGRARQGCPGQGEGL